jgi:hypothetical protein
MKTNIRRTLAATSVLALAIVGCETDTADDGLGDPVEDTDGTVDDGTMDDGTMDDGTMDDGVEDDTLDDDLEDDTLDDDLEDDA